MHQVTTEFSAQRHLIDALRYLTDGLARLPHVGPTQIVPVVVFMAFAVEAYINSVGFRRLSDWSGIERTSWKNKLQKLEVAAQGNLTPDLSVKQFISDLFHLRDRFAHGKPEVNDRTSSVSGLDGKAAIEAAKREPEWYLVLDQHWLDASMPKFRSALGYIRELGGFSPIDINLTVSIRSARKGAH